EPWPHLRALAVAQEVHYVAFAPQVLLDERPAQIRVDQIHQLDGARMHGDGARFAAWTGHAIDAAVLDAATRQLHREHGTNRAAADDEHGNFAGHRSRILR